MLKLFWADAQKSWASKKRAATRKRGLLDRNKLIVLKKRDLTYLMIFHYYFELTNVNKSESKKVKVI
jgi:hypothetical protein